MLNQIENELENLPPVMINGKLSKYGHLNKTVVLAGVAGKQSNTSDVDAQSVELLTMFISNGHVSLSLKNFLSSAVRGSFVVEEDDNDDNEDSVVE